MTKWAYYITPEDSRDGNAEIVISDRCRIEEGFVFFYNSNGSVVLSVNERYVYCVWEVED